MTKDQSKSAPGILDDQALDDAVGGVIPTPGGGSSSPIVKSGGGTTTGPANPTPTSPDTPFQPAPRPR